MPNHGTEKDSLERRVRGPVTWPETDGYDELRRTFNAMIERRPAVIVRPYRQADDDRHIAWARESAARFEPYSLRGAGYLNYSPSDETAGRVERAFGPDRFARLQAVKQQCDPDNRFRFNANIPPA